MRRTYVRIWQGLVCTDHMFTEVYLDPIFIFRTMEMVYNFKQNNNQKQF